MKKLWLIFAAAGGALAFGFYKLSRFDAEPAPYEVTRSEGRFELRRYPSLAVARTPMHGDRDASFKRLFRFISGENERKEKISMTTPVLFDTSSRNRMTFFMPAATRHRGIPQPASKEVEVDQQPGSEVAVVRFSGPMREQSERRAVEELRAWLRTEGLESNGEPFIAYYDSPMIPGPLRRNEAMIPIA